MSALLLPSLLAGVALGIVAGDAGALGGASTIPAPAGLSVAVVGAALRWRPLLAAGVLLLGVGLGAWRGEAAALPSGPGSVTALIGTESRTLLATAVDDPRPRGERQQLVVDKIALISPGGESQAAAGRVLVWLPRGVVVGAGDRVRLQSALEAPRDFDGFAYREYLARQGVAATASSRGLSVVGRRLDPLTDGLRAVRLWLLAGLNETVSEPEAALAAGILLGVRSGIDPAINDAFSRAGLTHVVAISGWNIAIVATLVAAATRPLTQLPAGRWLAALAAVAAVTGYVLLTGASPSVVRAALMAGALLLARLGGSRSHAVSALMLVALAMVLAAPAVVWDVGFQLSALATAGLIWFGAPFEARLARWPALIREPVALTMAAQLTTLPVILLNFERLSLIAPAANVLVVPLVPLVMLTSALAALVGAVQAGLPMIGDVLVWACGGAAWLYLRAMVLAGHAAAAVPMASLDISAPAWLAAVWYPVLLLARMRLGSAGDGGLKDEAAIAGGFVTRLARPWPLAGVTLAVIAALTVMTGPDGRLHLMALDIGQGDAILIVAPTGRTVLIDGGADPDLTLRRLGERLPFWQRTLDVVVLSHPHEDHIAGLIPALERFQVGTVLEPGRDYENPTYPRFVALAGQEADATVRLARAGDVISLGSDTRLVVLYPDAADAAAPLLDGDINNGSVVIMLESGRFRALLTGDAEAPVESLLLERGLLGPVDVLKVGHHGSESSTTPELLAAIRPRVALISCGTDNDYGHPHAVTLEHLAAVPGLVVRRTDLEGTIELVVDGSQLRLAGQGPTNAGSIGPWWFPVAIALRRSSPRWTCRRASWSTRGAWPAWRPRRRAWWWRPACRWTSASSRSPPCCTTSTSPRRAGARGRTAWWPASGSPPWASPSSRPRSHRTR
jgi:competence protein ComEC